ncbi:hypothetical protein [Magnetovibrio sp.]|uniref:hypothetical protein n=1 Tax=Magnetovibrio sp. TaxID=2024836 RepID=UPI002F9279DE
MNSARHLPGHHTKLPNILVVFSVFVLMMFGGYWHIFGSPFKFALKPGSMPMVEGVLSDRHINKHFTMNGVRLGMTPEMVRQLHPSTKNAAGRDGEPVLTVSTPRGLMVAWLFNNNEVIEVNDKPFAVKPARIYRLRLDEAYADLSEQTLIDNYARVYGRPIDANCNRNQLGDTPRCTYRWWGGDGIELVAIMKRKIDANGQSYVLLTTIATNTLKTSKLVSMPLRRANG